MNRQTGKVVDEILDNDERAREDDLHLISKTIFTMFNINNDISLNKAFALCRGNRVCIESITRERRRWMKKHPEIKAQLKATKYRDAEEQEYYVEYSPEIDRHLPHID